MVGTTHVTETCPFLHVTDFYLMFCRSAALEITSTGDSNLCGITVCRISSWLGSSVTVNILLAMPERSFLVFAPQHAGVNSSRVSEDIYS